MRSVIVSLLLVGCGSSSTVETSFDCGTATNADQFAIGFEKVGNAGAIDFRLVAAEPAQPTSGDNNWTIQLLATATGDPVTGVTMDVQAIPYLTHPLADRVPLTPLATPGRFLVVPDLWRPGVWDTMISVGTTINDATTFRFCVAN